MTPTMSVKVESNKKNSESRILSGQFMISHFEQEFDEYQDYNPAEDDDDDGCDDISESSNSKVLVPGTSSSLSACLALERYRQQPPEKHCAEIDSDLSQVFNTLNVTYK
jgi:hypothetical protein